MERQDDEPNEAAQEINRSLRGLVLFCSKRQASAWRELWDNWRYSEVVDFAAALIEEREREQAAIRGADLEYAEQITAKRLQ